MEAPSVNVEKPAVMSSREKIEQFVELYEVLKNKLSEEKEKNRVLFNEILELSRKLGGAQDQLQKQKEEIASLTLLYIQNEAKAKQKLEEMEKMYLEREENLTKNFEEKYLEIKVRVDLLKATNKELEKKEQKRVRESEEKEGKMKIMQATLATKFDKQLKKKMALHNKEVLSMFKDVRKQSEQLDHNMDATSMNNFMNVIPAGTRKTKRQRKDIEHEVSNSRKRKRGANKDYVDGTFQEPSSTQKHDMVQIPMEPCKGEGVNRNSST